MRLGIVGPAAVAAFAMILAAPVQAFIVNISGTQNGEQTGGVECTEACQGALIDPVQISFAAGTYTISDAYSPTTGLAPGALYDAWNFEAGNSQAWVWHWKALLDDGHAGATITPANYSSYILLNVDRLYPQDAFSTEAAAAALGAATPASTLTFSAPTTVDFIVNDYYLPDNAGGVSLDIEAMAAPGAVPEPAAWALLIVGFGGVGGAMRTARSRRGGTVAA